MVKVNKSEFKRVCEELEAEDAELTLAHLGRVFGQEFWVMIVYLFLDANDAARAIQGAIARLAKGEANEPAEEA